MVEELEREFALIEAKGAVKQRGLSDLIAYLLRREKRAQSYGVPLMSESTEYDIRTMVLNLVNEVDSMNVDTSQMSRDENLEERGIEDLIVFLHRREVRCKEEFDGTPLMGETTNMYIRHRLRDLFRELNGLERLNKTPPGDEIVL